MSDRNVVYVSAPPGFAVIVRTLAGDQVGLVHVPQRTPPAPEPAPDIEKRDTEPAHDGWASVQPRSAVPDEPRTGEMSCATPIGRITVGTRPPWTVHPGEVQPDSEHTAGVWDFRGLECVVHGSAPHCKPHKSELSWWCVFCYVAYRDSQPKPEGTHAPR